MKANSNEAKRKVPPSGVTGTAHFFDWLEIVFAITLISGASAIATENKAEPARIFSEPLVAIGSATTDEGTAALNQALAKFAASKSAGQSDWNALTSFLTAQPQSPWRVSLLLNLGDEYYQNGYFSRALEAWRQSWEAGKSATDRTGQAVANRAVAQLLRMLCRLGRLEDVKNLLAEVKDRTFRGSTAEMVATARESLWMMENHPEKTYRCGPHALERILLYTRPGEATPMAVVQSTSSTNGIPLVDVAALAKAVGLKYRMAKRNGVAGLQLPAVAHWRVNHYGAILKHEGGRYLLDDPTFGNGLLWVSEDALDSESDGYFLIPAGPMPEGWTAVSEQEGAQVWGRGYPGGNWPGSFGPGNFGSGPPPPPPPPDPPDDGDGDGPTCDGGMAFWRLYFMMADLEVSDRPLGYKPPVGPRIYFGVHYNHRTSDQPAVFNYANLGPLWNCDWISSLTFDSANAYYHRGQGGVEQFAGFDPSTQSYQPGLQLPHRLVKLSATAYEIKGSGGAKWSLICQTTRPRRRVSL